MEFPQSVADGLILCTVNFSQINTHTHTHTHTHTRTHAHTHTCTHMHTHHYIQYAVFISICIRSDSLLLLSCQHILVTAYEIGDLCYSILPCLLQFNMFLDVCNTRFLTKQYPQLCIQNYWQMVMIFCPTCSTH